MNEYENYNLENQSSMVNSVFDFSNALVDTNNLLPLVQYYYGIYMQYIKLAEEDAQRNEKLKYDYQKFECSKRWFKFKIRTLTNDYNNAEYNTLADFNYAVTNGKIRDISLLEIELTLDFSTGTNNNKIDYDNEFVITFKPYDIKFKRKSNKNIQTMQEIEDYTISLLQSFNKQTTIFNK